MINLDAGGVGYFATFILFSKPNVCHTPEAGISKNYCTTSSGSPEVVMRFCPWLILFKYQTGWLDLAFLYVPIMCLRSASGDRTSGKYTFTE